MPLSSSLPLPQHHGHPILLQNDGKKQKKKEEDGMEGEYIYCNYSRGEKGTFNATAVVI
jgi:hypothetical protein